MAFAITGGQVNSRIARRVRQISFNSMSNTINITVSNVAPTLIHLSLQDIQYSLYIQNLDAVNAIRIGNFNVTFGPPARGLLIPAATATNDLSRIIFKPAQFSLASVSLGLWAIATAAPVTIDMLEIGSLNDGDS